MDAIYYDLPTDPLWWACMIGTFLSIGFVLDNWEVLK